jgi:hypothetical protein
MQVDLTAEELEIVLIALKQHAAHRRADGHTATQAEDLIARLEEKERDFRRTAPRNP